MDYIAENQITDLEVRLELIIGNLTLKKESKDVKLNLQTF